MRHLRAGYEIARHDQVPNPEVFPKSRRAVLLICPTCPVSAPSVGAGDRLLLCMGLFSIFLAGGTVSEVDGSTTFADRPSAGSYGVVDEIARRVIHAGGRVLGVRKTDISGGKSLAAVLRYP